MVAHAGRACLPETAEVGRIHHGRLLQLGMGPADGSRRTGLLEYVDYLVSSAQAGYRKPHPHIYRQVLSLAGRTAKDAVFVGDSLRTDVLGPRRSGIRSFLLAPAAGTPSHVESVSSLAAIPRLLSG